MEIWINKDFCILGDSHSYILGQKCKDRLLHIGFFVDIRSLLQEYVNLRCRTEKDITTIKQLIDYQNSLITSLNKAVQPLKIEVKQKNESK
tara:strand:+ start:418 stop:690 length:273 start_codon:yes stop_codon:yes gene_type:complete